MPYIEIKRLCEDAQYAEDFRLTTENYMSMCQKKDICEDKTLKNAKDNIQMAEDAEGESQIYSETTLPNYKEQSE